VIRNNALYYIEADHLGTPRQVVEPARSVAVWRWDLINDPFGESVPNANPDGDANQFVFDLRMPGQLYDAESALSYNYYRDYEAATGRFPQSDPIGLAGGVSMYGYVGGAPLGGTDLLGLRTIFIGGLMDKWTDNVISFQKTYPNSQYFSYYQAGAIQRAINGVPRGEPINLVGHSLGAATAAEIAASTHRKIDNLVTIDPVGPLTVGRQPPVPCRQELNVGIWVDVNANPGPKWDRSDYIADDGGKWGNRPETQADIYIEYSGHHADFLQMMHSQNPNGITPLLIISGP
jgi:RHS repeat-associated protein